MKLLRRVGAEALRVRGFIASLLALFIVWRGQAAFDARDLAGAGLYLLAGSLMILGCLFTYRNHYFFRIGSYDSALDKAAKITQPLHSVRQPEIETTLPVRRVRQPAVATSLTVRGLRQTAAATNLPLRRVGQAADVTTPQTPTTRKRQRLTAALIRQPLRFRIWLGILAFLISGLVVALDEQNPINFWVIVLWIIGFAMFALACSGQRQGLWPLEAPNRDELMSDEDDGLIARPGAAPNPLERMLLALIMLAAVGTRIYGLSFNVMAMHFDETIVGLMVRGLMHGNFIAAPLFTGSIWYYFPSGTIWSMVPGLVLFGSDTAAGLHFIGALFSVLNVFAMYLLLRLLFNSRVALIGAGLVATAPPLLHLSFYALGNEQVEFFWTISAYFLFKGLRSKRYLDFVWSGYAAAASLLFYHTSRTIFVLLPLFIIYLIVTRRSFIKNYWRQLGVFALAVWIMGAPTIYHTYSHPEVLLQRLGQVSILSVEGAATAFPSWNISPPNPLKTDLASILANFAPWRDLFIEQIKHTYLSLTLYEDRTYFYQTGKPLLPPPLAMLAGLGIAYALWRWRDPRYFYISIWFWVGLFFSTVLTINPPELLRMTGVVQVIFIFPAIAINKILFEAERSGWFARRTIAQERAPRRGWLRPPTSQPALGTTFHFVPPMPASQPSYLNMITAALIALLMTQGISQYFDQFRNRTSQWADLDITGYYLRDSVGSNYHVYVIKGPLSINDDYMVQYLAPRVDGDDLEQAAAILPFSQHLSKDVLFIVTFNHRSDGQLIQQLYPHAIHQQVPFVDGQPFFDTYILGAGYVNALHGVRAGYFAGDNVDKPGQLLTSRQEHSPGLDALKPPPANLSYPAVGVWEGAFYVSVEATYTLKLTAPNGWLALGGQMQVRLNPGQTGGQVSIKLSKGWHRFSMRVALAAPGQQVGLTIAAPAGPDQQFAFEQLFPASLAGISGELGNGDPLPRNPAPIPNVPANSGGGEQSEPPSAAQQPGLPASPSGSPLSLFKPTLVVEVKGSSDNSRPNAVGVDPQGDIFVGSDNPPHVYKFDKSGNPVTDWAVLPDGPEGAAHLADLVVDGKGQVYVMDIINKTLEVYDNGGKLIGHRNSGNKFAAYAPNGLAVDKEGNLYIANTGGSDIFKIDPGDNLVREIGGGKDFPTAGDPHRTNQPIDVTVTDDGAVYVVDLSQRIIKYSADGKYVTEWKIPTLGGGTASMHLASYKNIVYLSDNAAEGIYMLDPQQATSPSAFGGKGSDASQFDNPAGLATDANGKLYVADRNNRRVQVFDLSGK